MQFGKTAVYCGNICPWRSWITQRIPIPKNGGSNPFGQTKNTRKETVPRIFYIESAKIEETARRDLKPSVKKTVRWTVFREER